MRRISATCLSKSDSRKSCGSGYHMTEYERKEICAGSSLHFSAPETLLGEPTYTWHADIWSAGCVLMDLLLENKSLFSGSVPRDQLELIYKICGTPKVE